jgi:long-subunit acyl-CoA synthetase (AMP-forming)
MWEIWKKLFEEVLNKHPPIQQKKIRSKKVPWITSEIKKLINKRDRSKRKAIIKNLEADWLVYKQTRNKVKIEMKKAKKDYYSKRIAGQKQNPKEA